MKHTPECFLFVILSSDWNFTGITCDTKINTLALDKMCVCVCVLFLKPIPAGEN